MIRRALAEIRYWILAAVLALGAFWVLIVVVYFLLILGTILAVTGAFRSLCG